MKIQCNVCEAAEAAVICCADEAALCLICDQKVHAANRLASKHQRVPLCSSSSPMPKCDICQETVGYFFCLEDRALLCRKCDLAVHTVNTLVSAHQRFLLTGVKTGIEVAEPGSSSSFGIASSRSDGKGSGKEFHAAPKRITPIPQESRYQAGAREELSASRLAFSGGSAYGGVPPWSLDELLAPGDHSQNFYFMDNGSSKADSGKLGDSDSGSQRVADAELECDDCIGQVPDSHCTVPQMPSPPTISGLWCPKNPRSVYNTSFFVPDICSSLMQDFKDHRNRPYFPPSKRRKNL